MDVDLLRWLFRVSAITMAAGWQNRAARANAVAYRLMTVGQRDDDCPDDVCDSGHKENFASNRVSRCEMPRGDSEAAKGQEAKKY